MRREAAGSFARRLSVYRSYPGILVRRPMTSKGAHVPITLTGVLICVIAGLVVGSGIAFNAPRLVNYRLDDPEPEPPLLLLAPVIGGWLTGYRPVRALVLQILCVAIFLGLYRHYGAGTQVVIACGY